MEETFKPVKGFERYHVSNYGRVINTQTNKEILPEKLKNGYLRVRLSDNMTSKRFLVHRLVALTFIPNPNNLPIINHKNEIKDDNIVTNLEWCTYSYNIKYNGSSKKRVIRGEARSLITANKRQVGKFDKHMNLVETYDSLIKAGRSIGVDGSIIWKCCNHYGYVKSVHGYVFKYLD